MLITFKPFSREDLPLYYRWAEVPAVKNTWFLPGYEPVSAIEKKLPPGNGHDFPYIIETNGTPIGFIQYCDLFAYQSLSSSPCGVFQNEPTGTFCFDLFIAEETLMNKGLGTQVVKNFVQLMHENGARRILVDPSASNLRAIRCYEKAGFTPIRTAHDGVGDCLIMEYQP